MATKILHPPSPASHMFHPVASSRSSSSTIKIMRIHRALSAPHSVNKKSPRFGKCQYPGLNSIAFAKASEQSFGLVGDREEEIREAQTDCNTIDQIKESLYDALQGINRGIFGVRSEKKAEIEKLVKQLEAQNPTPEPTQNLDKMAGRWKLVYSTITILGAQRTKLGLRDFVILGDFFQTIDVVQGKAVNAIEFSARGLNLLNGQLRIEATFKVASESRVDISYASSSITPDQLMNMFKKNYDLLLRIFNPDGWLDITYPFMFSILKFAINKHTPLLDFYFVKA